MVVFNDYLHNSAPRQENTERAFHKVSRGFCLLQSLVGVSCLNEGAKIGEKKKPCTYQNSFSTDEPRP